MSAGSSEVRAGKAWVELGVKDGLKKGLSQAASQLKSFGKMLAVVGGGGVALGGAFFGGLVAAAHVFESMGSELHNMSVRTGVSVEALSALGYAAKQTGSDLGMVEFGLRRTQRLIADAASGNEEAIVTLNSLGLEVETLKN